MGGRFGVGGDMPTHEVLWVLDPLRSVLVDFS